MYIFFTKPWVKNPSFRSKMFRENGKDTKKPTSTGDPCATQTDPDLFRLE